MTRPISQARMQYYPTPPSVADAIAHALTRSAPGLIRAIDPACGEGTALCLATTHLGDPVDRYGIELNQQRAEIARTKLTRTLHSDIRTTRVANGAFGLCFLNPPYDHEIAAAPDEAAQRLELHFLQASLRYLAPAGVLVYLISDRRLGQRITSLLAYQLERIQVFRFPPEEYARFRQIVLFGTRKPTPCREDQVLGMLRAIHIGTLVPPDLPTSLDPPYPVPVSPRVPHLLFQNLALDPEDLVREIDQYGAYAATFHRLHPDTDAERLRPLMPLRRGHLALVLASGHLNNELVTDPRGTRLLVKGRTEKAVSRSEERAEDGSTIITERDLLKIVITALDLRSGEFQTIQ